jgi:cytochrome c553
MKVVNFAGMAFAALSISACANLDRSRNLHDPRVPALSLAQQVCSNCHGIDGNSISPNFPRLAGQTIPYLVEQLKSFRKHSRSDPPGFEYMWGLSRSLTDEQIDGLASYFASQKPVKYPAATSTVQVSAGKKIFEAGIPEAKVPACNTCHGDHGQGNEAIPRLAGQHADYVLKQLTVFQRTDERPEGAVMKIVAHDMTESNMREVAAFLQAMSPE